MDSEGSGLGEGTDQQSCGMSQTCVILIGDNVRGTPELDLLTGLWHTLATTDGGHTR